MIDQNTAWAKAMPYAAGHQHLEAPGHRGQAVAGDEHDEDEHQQPALLDGTGGEHHRQRHQGHHPGIDGQHQADLRGAHVEAAITPGKEKGSLLGSPGDCY